MVFKPLQSTSCLAPVPAAASSGENSFSTVLIGGALVAVVASIVAFAFYREKLR